MKVFFPLSLALMLAVGTTLVILQPQSGSTAENVAVSSADEVVIPVQTSATVLFGGDMMFDRTIRTAMTQVGSDSIFTCIDPLLHTADLVVANLEGPITNNASVSEGSDVGAPDNFQFTFPTFVGDLLARHNIFLANLGNNHILNFGEGGVASTKQNLFDAGISYFGDPITQSAVATYIHDVPLAFINYNEFTPKAYGGEAGSASSTLAQIAKAKADGYIPVVYTHWGVEYATASPQYVHDLAHAFVDAGAALVVGSHPHVVEDHEVYNGATIYYSLGNFIFDQYFSDAVDHGLLLKVIFAGTRVALVQEIPVQLSKDRRTCPVTK